MPTTLMHASETGLSPEDKERLDALFAKFRHLNARSIGYPCNQVWDYSSL